MTYNWTECFLYLIRCQLLRKLDEAPAALPWERKQSVFPVCVNAQMCLPQKAKKKSLLDSVYSVFIQQTTKPTLESKTIAESYFFKCLKEMLFIKNVPRVTKLFYFKVHYCLLVPRFIFPGSYFCLPLYNACLFFLLTLSSCELSYNNLSVSVPMTTGRFSQGCHCLPAVNGLS